MAARILTIILALIALSAAAFPGVKNGSKFTNSAGSTVTYNGRGTTMGDNRTTMTDEHSTSAEVAATPTPNGCGGETDDSADMHTHGTDANGDPNGEGSTYRIKNGKAQEKGSDGTWSNMPKARGVQLQETNCGEDVLDDDTVGTHPDAMPGASDEDDPDDEL